MPITVHTYGLSPSILTSPSWKYRAISSTSLVRASVIVRSPWIRLLRADLQLTFSMACLGCERGFWCPRWNSDIPCFGRDASATISLYDNRSSVKRSRYESPTNCFPRCLTARPFSSAVAAGASRNSKSCKSNLMRICLQSSSVPYCGSVGCSFHLDSRLLRYCPVCRRPERSALVSTAEMSLEGTPIPASAFFRDRRSLSISDNGAGKPLPHTFVIESSPASQELARVVASRPSLS